MRGRHSSGPILLKGGKMKTLIIDATTEHNEVTCCIRDGQLADILMEDIGRWMPSGSPDIGEIRRRLKENGHFAFPAEEPDFEVEIHPAGSPFGTAIAQIKCWGNDDILERSNATYITLPKEAEK